MAYRNAMLIVNPTANHGQTAHLVDRARALFEAELECRVELTTGPGHAEALARDAGACQLVVAMGGDGTVHEVVNGLVKGGHDDTVLGILPTGSGNDYCRTAGIATSIEQAAHDILAGRTRRLDLGLVNGIYFANSLALGFDARVADAAVRLKQETGRTGLVLYLSALLEILWRNFYCHRIRFRLDDGPWQERSAVCLAAMIGPSYGGGFMISPHAIPDDGLFDVCLIGALTRNQALVRLPLVVIGRHERLKAVTATRAARLEVECAELLPAALDGEVITDTRYEVQILPSARLVAVSPHYAGVR